MINISALKAQDPNNHLFSLTGFFGKTFENGRYKAINPNVRGLILMPDNNAIDRYVKLVRGLNVRVFSENLTIGGNFRDRLLAESEFDIASKVKRTNDGLTRYWGTSPMALMICDGNTAPMIANILREITNVNREAHRKKLSDYGMTFSEFYSVALIGDLRAMAVPRFMYDEFIKLLDKAQIKVPAMGIDLDIDVFDFTTSELSLDRGYTYSVIKLGTVRVDESGLTTYINSIGLSEGRVVYDISGFDDYTVGVRKINTYHIYHLTNMTTYINYNKNPLIPVDDTKRKTH